MPWNPFGRRGKSPGRSAGSTETALAELERKAAAASPEYKAQFFARAAELCADSGDRARALRYWGSAIDMYLRTARPRAAAALCRKVIAFAPDVIRARRTLALLAIGEGRMAEAFEQLEEYVRVVEASGEADLAIKQLRLMGEATWSKSFRGQVAELLLRLGDAEGAEQVSRPLPETSSADETVVAEEAHDRWSTILRVALMSPDEARRTL